MASPRYDTALIVGAGAGLSASLARLFSREGIRVALAARNIDKLTDLCKETGAQAFACDATDLTEVTSLFEEVERRIGAPDVVVFNASGRTRGGLGRPGKGWALGACNASNMSSRFVLAANMRSKAGTCSTL